MTDLAHTTSVSELLCRTGCGKPRQRVGSGDYSLLLLHCLSCAEQVARLEDAQTPCTVPRCLAELDAQLGPGLAARKIASFPRDGSRGETVSKVVRWLDGFLAGATENLYLCGGVGEGKTGLA